MRGCAGWPMRIVANIAGFSLCPGFASTTRTLTACVEGSIESPIFAMVPWNASPGYAANRISTGMCECTAPRSRSNRSPVTQTVSRLATVAIPFAVSNDRCISPLAVFTSRTVPLIGDMISVVSVVPFSEKPSSWIRCRARSCSA